MMLDNPEVAHKILERITDFCYDFSKIMFQKGKGHVDILDPVQVSARNMQLEKLKQQFGKDICFYGGLDVQKLISMGDPKQIKKEVKRAKELFAGDGGIILGPSHYITAILHQKIFQQYIIVNFIPKLIKVFK